MTMISDSKGEEEEHNSPEFGLVKKQSLYHKIGLFGKKKDKKVGDKNDRRNNSLSYPEIKKGKTLKEALSRASSERDHFIDSVIDSRASSVESRVEGTFLYK